MGHSVCSAIAANFLYKNKKILLYRRWWIYDELTGIKLNKS